MNIEYLFNLFLEVWDESWARKITGNPGKKKQWAEMLTGKSREELEEAHTKARMLYDTVPTPKQFLALLPERFKPSFELSIKTAAEIAINAVNKRFAHGFKDKNEYFLQRNIIIDLTNRIYACRSEHCDFAVCAVENCYHYEIFEKPYLGAWLCKKHFEG